MTKWISLGYSCSSRKYINSYCHRGETHFFDWIGAPMWAINELIQNNFDINFDSGECSYCVTLSNEKAIMTHRKYYLRMMHDFPREGAIKNIAPKLPDITRNISEKYRRRSQRFMGLLKYLESPDAEMQIFLRLEEPHENRIIPDEHLEKYNKPELEYIIDFARLLKQRGCKKFKVIYIMCSTIPVDITIPDELPVYVLQGPSKITWDNASEALAPLCKPFHGHLHRKD